MLRTSLSITEGQLRDADIEAQRRGISRSQFFREAIVRELGRGDLYELRQLRVIARDHERRIVMLERRPTRR